MPTGRVALTPWVCPHGPGVSSGRLALLVPEQSSDSRASGRAGKGPMGVPAPWAAPVPLKILHVGPWPGLTAEALGPEGKLHPQAKAFLLFEGNLVPGSHPRKVPESACAPPMASCVNMGVCACVYVHVCGHGV